MTKKEADDVKRLFGVVAEDLRSDIRQVAEGVGLLNERFDGLEGRFDGLEGRFDRLEGRFDRLDAKVDQMGRELTAEIREGASTQGDLRERVARLESERP